MNYYTDERNAQIVISLLKAHNIKRVIASPGTTNICMVASMMHDDFFEMYSSPEERSAAYMACGMAAETKEPVVIICTGATASRNYLPGLTEAFYRKLPVLAITCSRRSYRIGHNIDQVTDRTQLPKDVAKVSIQIPLVYDCESEWACVVNTNKALLELRHNGGGPVHINVETNYSLNYSVKMLPEVRLIKRYTLNDSYPKMPKGKIVIFVGSHLKWEDSLTRCVDEFCERYDSFVVGDLTSNYKGKYLVSGNITGQQKYTKTIFQQPIDLLIHLGEVHAPWYSFNAKQVWRVNPDGELRDTFRKLTSVFEMEEFVFFHYYVKLAEKTNMTNYKLYIQECNDAKIALNNIVDNMPFSNAWIAAKTIYNLPINSELHLGIQNSLRFWQCFDIDKTIDVFCNVGGFGIDGSMSSVIGASLVNPQKLYYCVLGDLAFFYDINSLGNRHIGSNVRIVLVNNGKGTEFKLRGNPGSRFGDETDDYIAAAGHYGNKSTNLVKHYATDLGFEYYSANTKQEYRKVLDKLVSPVIGNKPLVVEVFTESSDEDVALYDIMTCMASEKELVNAKMKTTVKNVLGDSNVKKLKNLIGK